MIADILAEAGSEELGIVETDADSEELTIIEASLEFGMSEALLRQELRAGRIQRIPHRSRVWVRRGDVAALAASPQTQVARPALSPARWPRNRQSQRAALQAEVLLLVGELGEASVNQIQQRLNEGGEPSTAYLAVGTALRELAKEGKLAKRRDGHRLLYHLRIEGEEAPVSAPRPAVSTFTPRRKRVLPLRLDAPLTPLEESLLAAMRKPGNANLDQLYRTLTQAVNVSYPEFVLAVRSLVQKGLVIRIQERGRYNYEVVE